MIENYLLYPLNINGSFSSIYKGIHIHKNKKVIIKFSNDTISKKLIENEIKFNLFLKKLKFNFIPKIINIGTHNNEKYIITEYKNKTLNFKPFKEYSKCHQSYRIVSKKLNLLPLWRSVIKPKN